MAISTKPNITVLWADQGSYEAPTDAKILQGWVAEIPPYESQNWWQHRADEAFRHIYQAGIPVWDANTLYTANRSIVQSSDGVLWRALVDNTGQNPLTTGAWSRLIQEGRYVPPGAIIEFPMVNAVPAGYLLCDGTPKSRAAYPELFAYLGTTYGVGDGSTTFNLPDYRGVFRRGWDAGRGLDPNRTLIVQPSQNLQHNHSGTTNDGGSHTHSGSTSGAGNHVHSGSTSASGDHSHQVDRTVNGPPITVPPGFGNFVFQYASIANTYPAGNHTHSLAIDAAGGHTHDLSISIGGNHNHIFATSSSGGSEARPINMPTLVCIKF